jgi:hypothetical protein
LRRTLELIVNRVFRSRIGVAALLAVIVISIVGSAKLVGTSADGGAGVLPPPPPEPTPTASATTTPDPAAGDDGVVSTKPPPAPVTSPGTAKPLAVARAFALAWLHHRDVTADQWRAGLLPHSTENLSANLADTEPVSVPADRITGDLALIPRGKSFVEVTVPVDSGRLRLRLIAPEGRWLVDGVDWSRS